jgi:3-oxoacyl-[acyl-carrier protein] reductase
MSLAVVTGATEGIGRALVLALAADGWDVAFCARTGARVEELAAEVGRHPVRALGARCDVSRREDVAAFTARVLSEAGPPELLVNNAGIARWGSVAEFSPDDWDAVIGVNLTGMFLVTRALLPVMLEAGRGTIVNVSSLAGRNGVKEGAAYSASKHGVLGFSRSLMLEVRNRGVRVITVCPGSVDTPIFAKERAPFEVKHDTIMRPEDLARIILDAVRLPQGAMVSELDIRPTRT